MEPVTAKEMLDRNGSFRRSDLIDTARRLHALSERLGVPYAIIGGLAVVRNGAPRTTADVDVLIRRSAWRRIEQSAHEPFVLIGTDAMKDTANDVDVDLLFADDDWGMAFRLPDPAAVAELDEELGARFIGLMHLLELKAGVFLQKTRDDGPEIAAKDLADIVALIQAHRETIDASAFDGCHPAVRAELARIALAVTGSKRKRGPRGSPA
jgi:hypothetical protein